MEELIISVDPGGIEKWRPSGQRPCSGYGVIEPSSLNVHPLDKALAFDCAQSDCCLSMLYPFPC